MIGHTNKSCILNTIFSIATILAMGSILLNNVYAETDVVDDVTVTVPESCSLSSNIPSGQEHTAEIVNNHYEENIGTTNFTVYCNDNEGFAVYAIGYSNDTPGTTDMLRVTSNNPLTLSSDIVIPTGTGTTSQETSGASNWAMKLTAGRTGVLTTYNPIIAGSTEDTEKQSGDTNYSNYAEVPSEYTKVAYLNSATDIPYVPEQGDPIEAVGSNFTSTYAVYISPTQPAGTYNGKVKYTVVHPANATVPTIPLAIQDTAAVDAAVPNIGDTATAIDSRDGTEYLVGRLADGKIWLLENLALDLTAQDASTNITAANTNAKQESLNALLINGVQDGGRNGSLARATVSTSWEENDNLTTPLIYAVDKDKTMAEATDVTYEQMDASWPVGVYYNFCAASAGSYCYDSYEGISDATEDICPAGWRMPRGFSGSDYEALYDSYSSESNPYTAFRSALRVPLSGSYLERWEEGDNEQQYPEYLVEDHGKIGYFWSSTRHEDDGNGIRYLGVYHSGNIEPNEYTEYHTRDRAFPVRCVMKPVRPQSNVSLQDTDAVAAAVPNIGDTAIVMDSRDGTSYTIGRLADDRIWLLDNLALDLTAANASTNITATNTNASAASLTALFGGVQDGGTNGNLARSSVGEWTDDTYPSYTDPLINTSLNDYTLGDITPSGEYDGIDADWLVGTYYNYCAASAGSYCYDENSGSSNAVEDICPAGWRMPTGGNDGEYMTLFIALANSSSAFRNALRLPFSGEYWYDFMVEDFSYSRNKGEMGWFWSVTIGDKQDSMTALYYYSGFQLSSYWREEGLSIRCIMNNN